MEEIKDIDYNEKIQGSGLHFHKTLSKIETSYSKVPWSYSRDGKLRSGDLVMITNDQTKGFLVIDIGDKASMLEEKYVATTSS